MLGMQHSQALQMQLSLLGGASTIAGNLADACGG